MKRKPLVSVVIPCYNEEKYISFCIFSLMQQTYPHIEIICVDDGSTDNSKQRILSFPGVIYLSQQHKGPGAARNMGVKKAKGEIIALADADMRFDKHYLANLIKPILNKNVVGTFVKEEYVANPENIWSKCWSINASLPFHRRIPVNYKRNEDAFRAIKKSYFLKGGGYETSVGYTDDGTLSGKIHLYAVNAPGAKSYHYNPSSLLEVFYSARWIGRSVLYPKSFANLLRFSVSNSLRISIKYLFKGAPFAIIPFKITYDAGVFVGIFLSSGKTAK